MSQNPGVALMIETDGPGGAEHMLLHLAERLRDRGYRVVPVGPSRGSGWLSGQLADRGFERVSIDVAGKVDMAAIKGLAESLRHKEVGLVHAHEFHFSVLGAVAARLVGIPHVITLHGTDYHRHRWHRRTALRWAALRSRGFVAVSDCYRRELEGDLELPPRKVTVIRNGVPIRLGEGGKVRAELGLSAGELLVLAVGNLYPVKGQDVLLRALAILNRRRPELKWRAALAGRGGEEAKLRRIAHNSGIEDRVHFLGLRSDVPDLLDAADVLAMPSRSEGSPLALLEAMLAGVPIVATSVGGIPEVVTDEETALLVPSEDSPALAASLERMLTSSALRAMLARKARRVAMERYTLDAMVDRYEGLYGLRPANGNGDLVPGPPPRRGEMPRRRESHRRREFQ